MLCRQGQSNQSAPVVANQSHAPQVKLFDERFDGLKVQLETVVLDASKFVRAAKADEIRSHHALSGADKARNHFAIEKRPGRFAVQTKDRLAFSFVHIM